MTESASDRPAKPARDVASEADRLRRYEETVRSRASDVARWAERRRDAVAPVDVALRLYDRDRVAVGSVLGSAVAFRLFLFLMPVVLFMIGLVSLVLGRRDSQHLTRSSGMGTYIGRQIEDAIAHGATTAWLAIVAGLVGALWTGWSLTKVMIEVTTLAWGLDVRRRAATSMRVLLAVVGLVVVMLAAAGLVNRVREAAGLAVGATSLVLAAVVYVGAWFFVLLALPRGTGDPSALLPGALLVGLTMAGLQGFSQFYASSALDASSFFGVFGMVVVSLGWFFIIGRAFVGAVVVNAVVWERFGSIAGFVFGLPLIRAIPRRFDVVNRFFDLHIEHGAPPDDAEHDHPHQDDQTRGHGAAAMPSADEAGDGPT